MQMEMIFITTLIESMLVLVLLAIPLVVTQLVRRNRRKRLTVSRTERSNGIEASAVILTIEKTGLYIGRQPQIRLQMQVIPEQGRNFIAELSDVDTAFDQSLRSGSTIRIKYNPDNMRDITLIRPS